MRILFIAPLGSIHSKRWIEYFSNSDRFSTGLLAFSEEEGTIANTSVYRINTKELGRGRLGRMIAWLNVILRVVRQIKREFRPEIIHVHSLNNPYVVAASLFRLPIVATPWGSDIVYIEKKPKIMQLLIKRLLKKARLLICDAAHLKERMVELGAPAEKIDIIYFGTNLEDFSPDWKDPNLLNSFGWPSETVLVISTRALKPIYDVETLIRAIPSVLDRDPNVRFLVVGGGENREQLEALAKQLGVEKVVVFAGRVSDEDMKRFLASSDIYVSTALSDGGLAASTAEAMACAIPAVITDFGDNEQWLAGGKAGITFPARNYQELADAIIALSRDSARRKEMGKKAREVIDAYNNYHKEMEKMASRYAALVSGRS
jgi:glycosyltransferase involved in cell wall biosynthesis